MLPKTVLIIGSQGQDGTYLKQQVKNAGDSVVCINNGNIDAPGHPDYPYPDLTDFADACSMIHSFLFDEIYYLAAYLHSSEEDIPSTQQLMDKSMTVHFDIPRNILAAIVKHNRLTKLFYASSSHIFGKPVQSPQNEDTPMSPLSPYAFTKMLGLQLCRFYRTNMGIHASCGILFNHESPLRPAHFITQRIVKEAVEIFQGRRNKIVVGNLNAKVDWGYAPDYTDAMRRIVQLEKPDDYIVASGKLHSVMEFIEIVFGIIGLDWKKHIKEDNNVIKKKEIEGAPLCGDFSRLESAISWRPRTGFSEMIRIMVEAELTNG